MKLHTTRLTFPDLQREEFSAKRSEPAEGSTMEFPDSLIVIPCELSDYSDVYTCRYDPLSVKNSFSKTVPTMGEHKKFFEMALTNMAYYKGVMDGRFVGFVRFRKSEKGTEVSICLNPEFRGKRLSKLLLKSAIAKHGYCDDMYAEIFLGNVASFKTFAAIRNTADGALLEFVGMNVPVMDIREKGK